MKKPDDNQNAVEENSVRKAKNEAVRSNIKESDLDREDGNRERV
jgi:hypothetical protein